MMKADLRIGMRRGDRYGFSRPAFTATTLLSVLVIVGAFAACSAGRGTGPDQTASLPPAVSISVADLPGSWGLASYRNEDDRARTETEAKAACKNPYKITQGPNGGVMMYLADQSEPSEVFIKEAQGWTFIGPDGPPGVREDRVVTSYENNVMITEWVDASARERYGTMLFVRCGRA
jgi:hypothetical protein